MMPPTGPPEPDQGDQAAPSAARELEALAPPSLPEEPFEVKVQMSQYSQMDTKWGFDEGTHRSMCGIICTFAVMEHQGYRSGQNVPGPTQILERIRREHGWHKLGVTHAAEVDMLKQQGFLAWRRNWEAPPKGPQFLIDNEGYDQAQVDALLAQERAEAGFAIDDRRGKATRAILDSLERDDPVIASVKPNYGNNAGQHQIIIRGWGRDDEGEYVLVMDPERPPGQNLVRDSADHFFYFFNNRAIFARHQQT